MFILNVQVYWFACTEKRNCVKLLKMPNMLSRVRSVAINTVHTVTMCENQHLWIREPN